jgi:Leucine carboxyl methyltransferase
MKQRRMKILDGFFNLISLLLFSIVLQGFRYELEAFNSVSFVNVIDKSSRSNFLLGLRRQPLKRIRGDSYGMQRNSTIPTAQDAAVAVGVKPPDSRASVRKWKWAYVLQKYATPILHLFDRQKPPNSSLNVYCLWWKALSGNDKLSPVFDQGLSYDLLPRGTRCVVVWFKKLFPRLHHANVEIRTAYLDQAITQCVSEQKKKNASIRIRLIALGAGYDVRSIKLKERGVIDEAIELDLPTVIDAKQRLLSSKRFQRRRPQAQRFLPKYYYRVDLNNITHVETILNEILSQNTTEKWHSIFVFEAVMIYLNEDIPHSLLKTCYQALIRTRASGSLVFADRLENVPGGNYSSAVQEMQSTGWNLVEWLPKPGLARHMGRANMIR